MEECLKVLSDRLTTLENSVGSTNPDNKFVSDLAEMKSAIKGLADSRDRVKMILKRADEIQEYVSPGFLERQALDVSAQREYVVMMENNIHSMTDDLSHVQELSPVLDSDSIRKLQVKGPDTMRSLEMKQLKQLVSVEGVSNEVADLIKVYNQLAKETSSYLLQISNIVMSLEGKESNDDD